MPSLKIDLIVDDKGNVTIQKTAASLEGLNKEATKLGASFSSSLTKMEGSLAGMNASLQKTEAYTKTTQSSMAGLSRSILRLYAEYYVLSSAIGAVGSAMLKSMNIIDEYNGSITTMAALVTSMMKFNPGESLAQGYQRARTYAEGLVKTMEDIDKHSSMNQRELIAMAQAMTREGVKLNYANAEAVKGFTDMSNALSAVVGDMPDRMRQINQEIKALLTGQTRPSDQLAKTVASMTPNFKEQLEIHKKAGDVWEWLGKLVKGFGAAQSDIDRSWQATKSTLETIATQVLREGFGKAYGEIIEKTKQLSKWALDHKKEIADLIDTGWNVLKGVVTGIAAPFEAATYAVTNFGRQLIILSSTMTGIYISGVIATAIETGKLVGIMKELVQVVEILASRALLTLASRFGVIGIAVGAATYGVMAVIDKQKEWNRLLAGNDLDTINKRIDEYTKKMKAMPTAGDLYAQAQNRGVNPYQKELDQLFAARSRILEEQKKMAKVTEDAKKAAAIQLNPAQDDDGSAKKAADEAARLLEQYNDLKRTLTGKIEMEGLDDLGRKLRQNQLDYENLLDSIKKQPAAHQAELAALGQTLRKRSDIHDVMEQAVKDEQQRQKDEDDQLKTMASVKRDMDSLLNAYGDVQDSLDPAAEAQHAFNDALSILNEVMERDIQKIPEVLDLIDRLNAAKTVTDLQRDVDYYAEITGMEEEYYARSMQLIEAKRLANIAAHKDVEAENRRALNSMGKIEQEKYEHEIKHINARWDGYSDFFDGLSGLYKEDSKEQKTLQDVALAFQIAQQAQLSITALYTAATAVINQATGDPYTAFERMAAMAAALAPLLAVVGQSLSGGSGGSGESSAYQPTTVFGGESGQASESIANSLDLLNDIEADSYSELVGIHSAMRSLSFNLTGAIRQIVQGYDSSLGTYGGMSSPTIGNGPLTAMTSVASMGAGFLSGGSLLQALSTTTIGGSSMAGFWAGLSAMGPVGWAAMAFSAIDIFTGGKLTEAIGNFIGGSETRASAQGFAIGSTSIGNVVNAGAGNKIYGWDYLNTRTEDTSMGSHSYGNDFYNAAWDTTSGGQKLEKAWSGVYEGMSNVLIGAAKAIGSDSILANTMAYQFEPLIVNLLSIDPDKYEEVISAELNRVADVAAETLFKPLIEQFQNLGEGAFETITRIVSNLGVVKELLDMTGQSMSATAEAAFTLSESLIGLAGDLDTLTGYVSTYYDAFISDAQKQIDLQGSLQEQLSLINQALPATRDGYADLVESLDLNTQSGQEAYYTLMRLSGAADEYYDYLEKRMEDLLSGAIGGEKDTITASYNEQLGILNEKLDAAKNVVSDLTGIVNKLKAAKESMRLEDEKYLKGMYQWSMGKLGQMVAQSQSGKLPTVDQLDKITGYLTSTDNAKYYSSEIDYQRDYWKVYNQLGAIETEATSQLSAAERTVQLIEQQIEDLKEWYEAEMGKLDSLYDALMGIDNSIMSLAQAIGSLAAMQASAGNITPGMSDYIINGGTGDPILNLYSMLFNRNPLTPNVQGLTDVGGYGFWKAAYDSGYSIDQIIDEMMGGSEYAAIKAARGYAYGGISSGPESGYAAKLHGTELVVSPKSSYPATVQGSNVIEMAEMKKDIKALREESKQSRKYLDEMRRDMREWNTTGLLTRTS